MEKFVTETGLIGKGVDEGNEIAATAGFSVTTGSGVVINGVNSNSAGDSLVGVSVGRTMSFLIFRSDTTTSCDEPS